MSRDDEAQVAEAADAVAACVDHVPASAASAPVANVTDATQAGMPAPRSTAAPTPEPQPQVAPAVTVTTAARAYQAKLIGKVTNQSTLVRRARAEDEDVARHGAKKPRRDPATATASFVPTKPISATTTTTAAAARPRGKENGAAQYSVAAELEKQLQARLEWSERQKRREEEAKRFRQRQRDEEAVCFAFFFFSGPSDLLGLVLTRTLLSSCRPASGKSWRNFVLHSTRLAGNLPPKVPQVRARSGGHRPRFIYLILPHDLLFTETFCSWLMDFLVRERRQSVDGRAWLGEVYSEMIRNKMLPCTIVFAAA